MGNWRWDKRHSKDHHAWPQYPCNLHSFPKKESLDWSGSETLIDCVRSERRRRDLLSDRDTFQPCNTRLDQPPVDRHRLYILVHVLALGDVDAAEFREVSVPGAIARILLCRYDLRDPEAGVDVQHMAGPANIRGHPTSVSAVHL